MPEVTHESIKPMLESANQEGSMMKCVFKCPVSGTAITGSATIQKGKGLGDVAKSSIKRSMMWRLRSAVSRTVRSALGGGMLGRLGADVTRAAVSDATANTHLSFSDEEKQAAVVSAFESLSSQFVWEGKNNRWISASAAGEILTDFAKQLNAGPVTQKYDKGVMARMLVEIAQADGHLADEEKTFLADFITPDLGSVDELSKRAKLSTAEMAECSQGASRETMLMIAWALACTDKDLDPAEATRLGEQASGLGLAEARAAELKTHAQAFVIDQAMDSAYPGGKLDEGAKAEVMNFADVIGLERSEAERVEIRYRKRNGLV